MEQQLHLLARELGFIENQDLLQHRRKINLQEVEEDINRQIGIWFIYSQSLIKGFRPADSRPIGGRLIAAGELLYHAGLIGDAVDQLEDALLYLRQIDQLEVAEQLDKIIEGIRLAFS